MLVGCVNTPGFPQGGVDTDPSTGDCGSLFVAATPAANAPVNAKVAPIDTLQAALDIALNPGNNVGTLVGLAGGSAAFFTPNLTSTPNDLALALTYTSAGLGINSAGSVNVIPGGFAIDANSNIFVSASGSGSSHQMLAEFNNFGEPIDCADDSGYDDDTRHPSLRGLSVRQPAKRDVAGEHFLGVRPEWDTLAGRAERCHCL